MKINLRGKKKPHGRKFTMSIIFCLLLIFLDAWSLLDINSVIGQKKRQVDMSHFCYIFNEMLNSYTIFLPELFYMFNREEPIWIYWVLVYLQRKIAIWLHAHYILYNWYSLSFENHSMYICNSPPPFFSPSHVYHFPWINSWL